MAGGIAATVLGPRRRSRRSPVRPTRHPAAEVGLPAGRRSVHVAAVSGLAALAVLAAACSGGSGAVGPTASGGARPAAVVDVRASALGRTLVDGQGRTLYLFEVDQAGKSECNGGCAVAWPPYVGGGTPRAGTGVTGSLLGTTTRGDGGTQVTYGGHPLYYYAGDVKPGDDAGQGLDQFGGKWYVLGPEGTKINMG
jgi:predicted lipoprotein with Yx(FWY)xxD motif